MDILLENEFVDLQRNETMNRTDFPVIPPIRKFAFLTVIGFDRYCIFNGLSTDWRGEERRSLFVCYTLDMARSDWPKYEEQFSFQGQTKIALEWPEIQNSVENYRGIL